MNDEHLLKETAKQLGLPALEADENGYASLVCDGGRFAIQLRLTPPSIELVSMVGHLPESGEMRHRLCEALLEANHRFQGTLDATLAADPQTHEVWLWRRLARPVAVELLANALSHHLKAADTWQTRIQDGSWGASSLENLPEPESNQLKI